MQKFYNKTFRNRDTNSMYIDDYLEELQEGKIGEMKAMGADVYPRDENDIFVPINKNTAYNLKMVQKTMNDSYGIKDMD